ncbi:MAG: AzlD domain-containing protein [Acidimicrobiia bacterium]|nr:MAG: AzlD domain-containing protein [Acidimicrobiia bacterium]
MTMWSVVVAAGVATFAMRFVFIGLFGTFQVPPWLERGLKYIAPAVLAAITVPAVFAPGASFDLANPFVPAAIIGGLAAWRTKSIGAAIVVGLATLWLLRWVF